MYTPPFEITTEILRLVSEISELFLKQYQMEKVADKVTYKVADKKLNPTEEKILKLIDSNPYMTINDICVNLKMSDSGVRKNLAALRAKCVIKRIGANKNGHWEIINK